MVLGGGCAVCGGVRCGCVMEGLDLPEGSGPPRLKTKD